MKIISAVHLAAQKHFIYPIVGRVLDRGLRWVCDQDGWEDIVSVAVHVMLESSTAVSVRTSIAEVLRDVGLYLSQDSIEVLRLVDEIARKHSPEAN